MLKHYAHILNPLFANIIPLPTKTKLALTTIALSLLHFSSFTSNPNTKPPNPNPKEIITSRDQSLLSLLKQCSSITNLMQIHAQIIQTGLDQDLLIMGKVVTFCATVSSNDITKSMDYAVSIFEQIKTPDGFVWNTMIRGFGQSREPEKGIIFYKRMVDREVLVDNFTFSFLLKICGQLREVKLGKQFHCFILKSGLDSHVFVRNTLIHMYGSVFKDMGIAHNLFEEMPGPDVVGWNTCIDCCVQCSKWEEALEMFLRMQRKGVEPDDVTLVIVLSACAELGALHFGRWIHSCFISASTNLQCIVQVCNSLIDMYAKCGEIREARSIFEKMRKKNIVSWNSMILGLANHGYADDALGLFSDMVEMKLETPNDVTFLGVLRACSHRGLVDEGRKYFNAMCADYYIRPSIKHYGCMVDLLGRAGLVEGAYDLIRGMPMEGNAIVWRTLLGACRVHGHLELGRLVRKRLMELEPEHSGDYVLIASMYAHEGRWNDMLSEREAMKEKRVQKPEPGNSLSLTDNNPTRTMWSESPMS
ncbi:hypothetical protein Scep_010303 [Stephania cephalantha]|uniref:Pentatricopeptide repeat-containing protein n=1 Tax=Stephania cephalantha TaxID=152367 RepID=A0AAP0JUV3_9MAGN